MIKATNNAVGVRLEGSGDDHSFKLIGMFSGVVEETVVVVPVSVGLIRQIASGQIAMGEGKFLSGVCLQPWRINGDLRIFFPKNPQHHCDLIMVKAQDLIAELQSFFGLSPISPVNSTSKAKAIIIQWCL